MTSDLVPTSMDLPAISLWQPYATLWTRGVKRCETRSWPAPKGGWYLVHAGKAWGPVQRGAAIDTKRYAPDIAGVAAAQRGGFVGRVYVGVVFRMTDATIAHLNDQERALGWWEPGRFGWLATRFVVFPEMVPARGQQGIWTVRGWVDPAGTVEVTQ